MAELDDIGQQLSNLESTISSVAISTNRLANEQQNQLKEIDNSIKWIRIGGGVMALVILAIIVLAGFVLNNASRVEDNTAEIEQLQRVTSTEALCPLYDIFLDSYNPNSPNAKADPKGYDDAFRVIERGAKALGCEHTTRGRD